MELIEWKKAKSDWYDQTIIREEGFFGNVITENNAHTKEDGS
ncbi:hypothetical protein [Paenibacillus brevis]|nr:hypothetical protein [Paenibacillus brevis]